MIFEPQVKTSPFYVMTAEWYFPTDTWVILLPSNLLSNLGNLIGVLSFKSIKPNLPN